MRQTAAPAGATEDAKGVVISPETLWRNERLVVVDVETTGTDAATARVVEVAALLLEDGVVVDQRSWLLDPLSPIPEGATKVHGITDLMVAGAPDFSEIAVDFAVFVKGAIPVGFNARFDRAVLLAEYRRTGLVPPPLVRGGDRGGWIDALVWARAADPWTKGSGRLTLASVAARLGVEVAEAHRALGDCWTTSRVLEALKDRELDERASGLRRMPERWEDLQLHQRRLAAEHEGE